MNKIQGSLRLSQTGPSAPRLLISSALMSSEGSVTLQLRESVQAPVFESNASKTRRDENNSKFDTVDNTVDNRPPFTSEANLKAGGPAATMVNSSEAASNVLDTSGLNASHLSKKTSIVVATQQPLTMTTLVATNTQTTSVNSSVSGSSTKKQRPKTLSPTRHGGPQQCQVCSKVFGNASALAKHKLTHSDERKYVCGMCSKAFKRQDHLNGHMLTHRNKKPYECKAEGCGKSYCDARSLRRHTENHHSSLVLSTSTTSSQVQSNSTTSNNGTSTSTITNPSSSTSDASSPNGATCIQYQMNCDGNTITTINAKSPTGSPTGINNEGLTRQQLNLISQIMQQQQSKQVSGQKTTAQRPRTWNMQTQLQLNIPKLTQSQDSPKSAQSTNSNNNQSNGLKLEQKPVECNLCHRKFKNIPALNGHMRLHGGYFKKENETKKSEKKDYSGPPLQTASVGVRALIEEKIINKRSKDLKGAFAIPAAPLSTRRLTEADGFLNIKNMNTISNTRNNTITIVASGVSTNSLNGLTKQSILQQVFPQTPSTCHTQKTQSSQLSSEKDATLIELLKRGTKVAVKRENSDQGQLRLLQATTRVLMPASSNASPEASAPSLVLSNGNASSPLSLTISQASLSSESSGIYTLAYSTSNSSSFLNNNEGRNGNDTAMLLQAVDSIQLLQDDSPSDQLDDMDSLGEYTSLSESQSFNPSLQLQAVLDSPLPDSLVEFGSLNSKDYMLYGCNSNESPTSSTSPLSSPLAYPTPPASHETSAQVSPFLNDSHNFSDANTFFHENDKTKTMMLDESNEFLSKNDRNLSENERILQLKNELLNDSKSVLEETSFFHINKSILDEHDLFKSDNSFLSNNSKSFIDDNNAKLQDFTQNLDFLNEAQAFDMDDDRNSSSPLSAAFFSATMSTAEEVKEALDEILPNEDDDATETLDLYFLSGHSLQSQMMSNSDDPLLSSIPRDFSSQRYPNLSSIVTQNQTSQSYDIDPFSPPEQKKIKTEHCIELSENSSEKTILSVQTDHASDISSVFMSPTSISSSSPQLQCALLTQGKKKNSLTTNDFAKRHELFKSDMKNSSQLHYTPSPMLNPKRSAAGLFKTTSRDKMSDVNEEMNVIDLFEKPRVNIGSDYQATLPFENDFFYDDDKSHDTLVWQPSVLKDERQLDRFVKLAKSSAVGLHSIDSALKILLENRGEIHVAILKLLQSPGDSEKAWNQLEIEQFLKGLEKYGKDFSRVALDIAKKTTGDCVQLYYCWKKLCSEYKSTHLPPNRDCISTDHNKDNNKTAKCDNNFFDYNNSSNLTIQNGNHNGQINSTAAANHNSELRPHVCEVPDCSASFSSRVALHGHTRIHCIGKNANQSTNVNLTNSSAQLGATSLKDDFPCKVCGK